MLAGPTNEDGGCSRSRNALTKHGNKLPWECQQTQELQKGGNEHGSGQIEEEWLYNLIL